jgi:sigma-B regulation protein RsbU (phosphoserine phosphatase)
VLAELRATDVARSLWLAELFAGQAVFVDDRAAFAREHPAARVLELFDSGAWAVVPVRSTESVGLLSVHFPAPRPVSELQQYLELCAEILASAWQRASEREALEITLAERDRIASTLSTTLLPPKLPVVAGFEFSAWLEPGSADGVAGDFYDMFAPPQGGWLAVMGDVCGKGAEAAAVTSLARYAARAAALDNPDPAHIAQVVNDALIVDDSDLYATMAIVRYDEAAPGAVRVALAGHPQPRLLSPAGIERLGDYGMPLGLFDGNVDVAVTAHEFPHGSTIVLFTDGLTERYPDLDDDALDRTLIAVTDHSAVSVCDALHRLVTTTSAPRIDDIAVLGATRLA